MTGPDDTAMSEDSRQFTLTRRISELETVLGQIQAASTRESGSILWAVLDSIPMMVCSADNDLQGEYFNRSWLEFRGTVFDDEQGEGWLGGVHPDDAEALLARTERVVTYEQMESIKCRLARFDGEYMRMRLSLAPRYNLIGVIAGLTITAFVEDDESSEEPEQRYRLLVENVKDAILISQDERFIFFNHLFPEMLGYTGDELQQITYRDIYTPKSLELLYQRDAQRKKGVPVASQYETTLRRKDGSEVMVEVNVNVINYRGKLATFSVLRDISQKRKLERERFIFSIFSLELAGSDSLQDLARILAKATAELFTWDGFTFSVRVSGRSRFRMLHCIDTVDGQKQDFDQAQQDWEITESTQQLHEGTAMLINRSADETGPHMQLTGSMKPSRCLMYVPVMQNKKLAGIIGLHSYTEKHFSEMDRDLVMGLAEHVRPSLARCLAERQSAAFSSLGKRLSTASTPLQVARIILHIADELLGWDAASINHYFAFNDTADSLVSYDLVDGRRVEILPSESNFRASRIQYETVHFGAKLLNKDDHNRYYRDSVAISDSGRAPETLMFVPMRTRNEAVGIITIQSYTRDAYDADDLAMLQTIADHGSGALERTRVEEKLRKSEERFRLVLEAARDSILQFDVNARVGYINPACAELFGYSLDSFLESDDLLSEIVHRAFRKDVKAMLMKMQIGEEFSDELMIWTWNRRNGDPVYTESRVSTIRDARGIVTGYLMTVRDVTERVMLEKRRKEIEAQLQQTQKLESIGLLAGGIAHDFNNLLTGILGNAELAVLDVGDNPQVVDAIHEIESAARRAAELTKQMLAYAGRGMFAVQPINLARVVREVRDLLGTVVHARATLVFKLDERLPYVEADSAQVRQVLMNLVTNASDALDGNAGRIEIRTGSNKLDRQTLGGILFGEACKEGEYVFLQVSDTGCGFGDETRERLFDPFFTKRPTGLVGSKGLGLSAVSGIVRTHKGGIQIHSVPGKGSTFTIYFPVATSVPNVQLGMEQDDATPGSLGNVLIIDSEAVVRKVAEGALRKSGYTPTAAGNATAGLEILRRDKDSVLAILLDLRLRDMGSRETLAAIRELVPDVPVLLMSTFPDRETVAELQNEQSTIIFEKPFTPKALVDTVQRAIGANQIKPPKKKR